MDVIHTVECLELQQFGTSIATQYFYIYIYICLSNDCSCFQSHHFFSEIWNVCRSGSMGTALNPFLWVWLYQTKKHLRIGRRLIRRQEILHHCVKTQKQGTIFLMSSTKLVEDSKYESIYLSIYIFIQTKENQYLKVAFGLPKMQVICKYLADRWLCILLCLGQ